MAGTCTKTLEPSLKPGQAGGKLRQRIVMRCLLLLTKCSYDDAATVDDCWSSIANSLGEETDVCGAWWQDDENEDEYDHNDDDSSRQGVQRLLVSKHHRWALTPISMISDIGLSLILELPISDWRERSPTLYWISEITFIRYPTSKNS